MSTDWSLTRAWAVNSVAKKNPKKKRTADFHRSRDTKLRC